MPKKNKTKNLFKLLWRNTLSDYVTAIAWSVDGSFLVASSAAGEVVQYDVATEKVTVLQEEQIESVDALAISADGQFLAAGGQAGTVWIWRFEDGEATLIETLEHSRAWIDCLRWHPTESELAFSFGRYVQVWDAIAQAVITTLNFETSSVLDIAWHPTGDRLSISGHQIIKTWSQQNWDKDPNIKRTGGANHAISWSSNGQYFASGDSTNSVTVWEDGIPYPWEMSDFPGKVRLVDWSEKKGSTGTPLLASASRYSVVVWTKEKKDDGVWAAEVLNIHQGNVTAIAFQPKTLLIASAAEDGQLCLWDKGRRLTQVLQDSPAEYSCLAWSSSGEAIAAGNDQGEILLWTKTMAGSGFG